MRRSPVALAVACTALLLPAGAGLAANRGRVHVIPPHAHYRGHSYGEWSAGFWQWLLGTPVHDATGDIAHPALILDGRVDCSVGQHGKVWFLAGTLSSDPANRSCSIPKGTALFFPILTAWADNANLDGLPPLESTEAQLRSSAAATTDHATSLTATVDGQDLRGLHVNPGGGYTGRFRAASPVFSYTVTNDNIIEQGFGATPFKAKTVNGAVADGVYIMLAPLSVGRHVIHWTGSSSATSPPFTQDITYTITVVRRGHS
jgi:hypothetical protein